LSTVAILFDHDTVYSLTGIVAEFLTDKFKASALIKDCCQIFKLLFN